MLMPEISEVLIPTGEPERSSGDGSDRVAFADGTLYGRKPNSWMAVEENSIQDDHAAERVAAHPRHPARGNRAGQ